ncbi:MAG: prephenate dehydratase [Planctomycetales bacterium]|nr:prephenate dehydratase [Planctomycetales bacterium]
MAKKKTPKRPSGDRAESDSLATLRRKIDEADGQILKLVNERASYAMKIGQIKQAANQPVYCPAREQEVLRGVTNRNTGPLPDESVRAIFRELISGSRGLEARMRVAFLGPEHTYSHLATLEQFGQAVDIVPVASIAAVFDEVHHGQVDYGIVPLENSTDGRIADTLHQFTRVPVKVCGEVRLRIRHALVGKCPRAEVTDVYSRPQALSQCRDWLAMHLPKARLVEVASTAAAAQLAVEKPGAAAIASVQAGTHYGLDLLAEGIEDNRSNVTRFAVIGSAMAGRTKNDRTVVLFQIGHEPGALADATAIFKRNRVNLTWIESFPISESEGEYVFFVEMEGHADEARVRRALAALEKKTIAYRLLGCHPHTQPVG